MLHSKRPENVATVSGQIARVFDKFI